MFIPVGEEVVRKFGLVGSAGTQDSSLQFNQVLSITDDFLQPCQNYRKMYGKEMVD